MSLDSVFPALQFAQQWEGHGRLTPRQESIRARFRGYRCGPREQAAEVPRPGPLSASPDDDLSLLSGQAHPLAPESTSTAPSPGAVPRERPPGLAEGPHGGAGVSEPSSCQMMSSRPCTGTPGSSVFHRSTLGPSGARDGQQRRLPLDRQPPLLPLRPPGPQGFALPSPSRLQPCVRGWEGRAVKAKTPAKKSRARSVYFYFLL